MSASCKESCDWAHDFFHKWPIPAKLSTSKRKQLGQSPQQTPWHWSGGKEVLRKNWNCSSARKSQAPRKYSCHIPSKCHAKWQIRAWRGRGKQGGGLSSIASDTSLRWKLSEGTAGTGCEPSHTTWSKCRSHLVSEFFFLLPFSDSWLCSKLCY